MTRLKTRPKNKKEISKLEVYEYLSKISDNIDLIKNNKDLLVPCILLFEEIKENFENNNFQKFHYKIGNKSRTVRSTERSNLFNTINNIILQLNELYGEQTKNRKTYILHPYCILIGILVKGSCFFGKYNIKYNFAYKSINKLKLEKDKKQYHFKLINPMPC